jgi:maleylacetoacetate isomerase
MADLCLVPQVYNARRWGVDMAEFKRIIEIDGRCAQLPAFQAAHPDRVGP